MIHKAIECETSERRQKIHCQFRCVMLLWRGGCQNCFAPPPPTYTPVLCSVQYTGKMNDALLMQLNSTRYTEWANSVRSYASKGQRRKNYDLMAKYNELESLYSQHVAGLRRFG
jgi:hypothetical protein